MSVSISSILMTAFSFVLIGTMAMSDQRKFEPPKKFTLVETRREWQKSSKKTSETFSLVRITKNGPDYLGNRGTVLNLWPHSGLRKYKRSVDKKAKNYPLNYPLSLTPNTSRTIGTTYRRKCVASDVRRGQYTVKCSGITKMKAGGRNRVTEVWTVDVKTMSWKQMHYVQRGENTGSLMYDLKWVVR